MAKQKSKVATPEVMEVPVTTAAPAPTTTVEAVQLTISDLQLLSRVVDLASRRGAFQASELSQVGDIYNKLAGFLAYVESTQPKAETTETPAAAETPAATSEAV